MVILPDQFMLNVARTHPPVLHAIAQRLRTIALASSPATQEEVKYGGILFGGSASFCGVFVYGAHVTLEFGNGAELPDPGGELLGNGKGRRHLKFTTEDEAVLARAAYFIALARAMAQDQPRR